MPDCPFYNSFAYEDIKIFLKGLISTIVRSENLALKETQFWQRSDRESLAQL